jgi:hypothetical protein
MIRQTDKNIRLVSFGFVLVSLAMGSCDPKRRLNMKNYSGTEVEITWKIKEDSLHKSPFFIESDKEQKFTLKPGRPGNAVFLSVGIGTWTPKFLRSVVDDLESMTIKYSDKEIVLDSEEAIFEYLLARRRGVGKDKIEIRIKDESTP